MEFFLSLYDISTSSFLVFFERIIDFFNTSVISILNRYMFKGPAWFDLLLQWLGIRKVSTQNSVVNLLGNVMGFDLNQPLWLFLLSNLGFIIGCLIVIKILDFVN